MRRGTFFTAVLCLWATIAQAQGVDDLTSRNRARVEAGAIDASLRTPLAVPTASFDVEIADDKKKANAKIGLGWGKWATTEVGFSGAFDKTATVSKLTSLRELTPGSSAWVSTTWKKYRVRVDSAAMNTVCRQAAWAEGANARAFECVETKLSDLSFAQQIAEIANLPVERAVCQRFVRAMLTSTDASAGVDLRSPICDGALDLAQLATTYGERFTASYSSRHAALLKADNAAGALALCNEYRRSEGLPPTAECDPAKFSEADVKQFARSWGDRFEKRRDEREAEVCDAYRRTRGAVATGVGACAPIGEDPLYFQSMRARYAAAYRWLGTPVGGFRLDATRQKFDYLDAALEPDDETHGSYSIGGHIGWLTVSDWLFLFQYSQGQSWKAPNGVELCRPVNDTDGIACVADQVLGPPTSRERRQFEGQIKGYLGESFAASVIVTRDTKKKAWGVETPFYFMKNKEGGLAGGLVFSYQREDAKEDAKRTSSYAISVFVGQVFDVF